MKPYRLLLIAAAALLPLQANAVTTSPGKTSVATSEIGALDVNGDIVPLAGQLEKGKKKTTVLLNTTITMQNSAAVPGAYVSISINGVDMNPGGFIQSQCDTASTKDCTITVNAWLDIDAAETATPGAFVGQPLVFSVQGGNAVVAASGLSYEASFSAQVVKK